MFGHPCAPGQRRTNFLPTDCSTRSTTHGCAHSTNPEWCAGTTGANCDRPGDFRRNVFAARGRLLHGARAGDRLGYQVNNQLTVKVRDLESVGEIIDQVTEAGGDLTRFQGIRFTIDDS